MENLVLSQKVYGTESLVINDVPHLNLLEQKIVIGNIPIQIANFGSIQFLMASNLNQNQKVLKLYEYVSMFMNNCGYTKFPSKIDQFFNGVTLENIIKDVPNIHIPNNGITFNQEATSLSILIACIFNWGRSIIEAGYVVDEDKSNDLPNIDEVKYNLAHHINIKRQIVLREQKVYWPITDLHTRRLHNICPHINPEYSTNCIRKFSKYTPIIKIKHPCTVFISAMLDPNIFFTMIRNSEIEAAKSINKLYHGYSALRDDFNTAILFQDILNRKIEHLHAIYNARGVAGFINLVRVEQPSQNTNTVIGIPSTNLEVDTSQQQDLQKYPDYVNALNELAKTPEEKRKFIEEFSQSWNENAMNEKLIKSIFADVDRESFPPSLTAQIPIPEGGSNYSPAYWYFLARLHFIFGTMKTDYLSYFDTGEKWIVSKPFWINEHAFALYNKKVNRFIVAFPNMTVSVCNAKGAIELYKNHYGTDILLDAEELGDTTESKAAPTTIMKDEIPIGDENKYIQGSIPPVNLEVKADRKAIEEAKILDKEEIAKQLATKYKVIIK